MPNVSFSSTDLKISAAIWCCIFCVVLILGVAARELPDSTSPIPPEASQLILVITDTEDSNNGELRAFSRQSVDRPWQQALETQKVMVGKKGLAWGQGLHPADRQLQPLKREGDGKATAGVFDLAMLYGFAEEDALDSLQLKMPYVAVDSLVECIDDPHSQYYNQIIAADTASETDWNSSEKMLRVGSRYEFGIVVDHNAEAEAGAGSCIFLHIWKDSQTPTLGCTAMPRRFIIQLFRWLDHQKRPVLVQLTKEWYQRYRAEWELP